LVVAVAPPLSVTVRVTVILSPDEQLPKREESEVTVWYVLVSVLRAGRIDTVQL
jgi:hypothetical protein